MGVPRKIVEKGGAYSDYSWREGYILGESHTVVENGGIFWEGRI